MKIVFYIIGNQVVVRITVNLIFDYLGNIEL